MTSFDTTAPMTGTVAARSAAVSRSRLHLGISHPMLALAVAAAIGAVLGAIVAIVLPVLLMDPATEHARLLEFADQLRDAVWRDYLWEISHP